MDFLKDWKFWTFIMSLLSFVTTVGLVFIGRWVYIKLRFNDLAHVQKWQEAIDKKIDKVFDKLGSIEKAQATRDAVCAERHE